MKRAANPWPPIHGKKKKTPCAQGDRREFFFTLAQEGAGLVVVLPGLVVPVDLRKRLVPICK